MEATVTQKAKHLLRLGYLEGPTTNPINEIMPAVHTTRIAVPLLFDIKANREQWIT